MLVIDVGFFLFAVVPGASQVFDEEHVLFMSVRTRRAHTAPKLAETHDGCLGRVRLGMTRSLSSLYAYCLFHLPLTLACDSPLCILCPADEPIVNSKISVHSKNDCKEILNFYQQVSKIF